MSTSDWTIQANEPEPSIGDRVKINDRYPNQLLRGMPGMIAIVDPDGYGYSILLDDPDKVRAGYLLKVRKDDVERLASLDIQLEREALSPKELALMLALAPGVNPGAVAPAETAPIEEPQKAPVGWDNYDAAVDAAAAKYEIPADIFRRLLRTENTTGNPTAVNPDTGATGLGQIMPDTADEMGINPDDPMQSIDASAKYLRALEREFGNWPDALRAYNWGPGHVHQWLADGGDESALPKETFDYVRKIMPGTESKMDSSWLAVSSDKKEAASSAGILVGTSGFKYKHWSGTFYPKDVPGREWLRYYATKFPTVEISSTFHNMPEPRVLKTWHDSTPDDFTFAIRAPKAVTHEAHLVGSGPLMSTFMRRLELLGDKLGPVTFQLLQSEKFDADVFKAFAESLPKGFKYSMEFRSEPWYNEAAYDIMRKHNIANVVVGHSNMGIHTVQTADWSHVRMSGHHPDYKQNSYTDEQLMNWRGIVADAKRPSYVYFNNEYMAYAASNAQKLMEIMAIKYKARPSKPRKDVGPRNVNPDSFAAPADSRSNGDDGYVEQHDVFEKTPPDSPADKNMREMGYPAQDW